MIDDLIVALLPLAHIVYYKNVRYLDDREFAKEDLISEAIIRLYQDMTLRWDKYIHVDLYYEYFSTVLRNSMIGVVHDLHNNYITDELDPENITTVETTDDIFDEIDVSLLRKSIGKDIIDTAERILKCRRVNTNLLILILKAMYVEKSGLDSLRSRVRVLGVTLDLFKFYCEHVTYVYKIAYNYHYAILGGNEKMIYRMSSLIDRFEDTTYKHLSMKYYDSIIPEIYAEFGPNIAKKFVKTFSGRTVQVPKYRDFCDDLLSGVVLTLADGDKSKLAQISDDYKIPYKILNRIYNKSVKGEENSEG